MRIQALFAALSIAVVGPVAAAPLVVHEWGTITTVHDAAGAPAGRLNRITASEVLPEFVHKFEPAGTRQEPKRLIKSELVPGRPDVTMRLETPVIYFYPPAGVNLEPFDVSVNFRGGVLNEFYPDGAANVVLDMQRIATKRQAHALGVWNGNVLNNYVLGSLEWRGLTLTDDPRPPATTSANWLAPRAVHATGVMTPAGESERYLFYRGVAHLDALLHTRLDSKELRLSAPARLLWLAGGSTTIPQVWVADIRADGQVAFREHGAVTLRAAGTELAHIKRFAAGEHSAAQAVALRASIKRALLAAGLFDDEAEAMLNTWKASYFQKVGLRVFYIVPREWLDYFLPLRISVPHELKRALVGRIDLS